MLIKIGRYLQIYTHQIVTVAGLPRPGAKKGEPAFQTTVTHRPYADAGSCVATVLQSATIEQGMKIMEFLFGIQATAFAQANGAPVNDVFWAGKPIVLELNDVPDEI